MTPDLIKRIRLALVDHAYRLDGCGSSAAAEVHDLIAALPPDPGGEMPEPMPGQVVDWYIDTGRTRWRRSLGWPSL